MKQFALALVALITLAATAQAQNCSAAAQARPYSFYPQQSYAAPQYYAAPQAYGASCSGGASQFYQASPTYNMGMYNPGYSSSSFRNRVTPMAPYQASNWPLWNRGGWSPPAYTGRHYRAMLQPIRTVYRPRRSNLANWLGW